MRAPGIQQLGRQHARERVEVGVRVRQDQGLDRQLCGHVGAPRHCRSSRLSHRRHGPAAATIALTVSRQRRFPCQSKSDPKRRTSPQGRERRGVHALVAARAERGARLLSSSPSAPSARRSCTTSARRGRQLRRRGAEVIGISVDSPYALKAFKRDEEHQGEAAVGLPPQGRGRDAVRRLHRGGGHRDPRDVRDRQGRQGRPQGRQPPRRGAQPGGVPRGAGSLPGLRPRGQRLPRDEPVDGPVQRRHVDAAARVLAERAELRHRQAERAVTGGPAAGDPEAAQLAAAEVAVQ